jgi:protein phosphatase
MAAEEMTLDIPNLCLVILIGPSGAGKSTFARRHFLGTEIISSDACRGIVCDDEGSLAHSREAFELVHFIARQRLTLGKLAVIDATNVQEEARAPLVALARDHDVLPVAIVLNADEETCIARNKLRPDRQFGEHVVRLHCRQMRRSLRYLKSEGFRYVHVVNPEDVEAVQIQRVPLWTDRRDDRGPFDIIGDIHGCCDELTELLASLGYAISKSDGNIKVQSPPGRKAIFLGDLCDRGPNSPEVLRLVMSMVKAGTALCVPGNHDVKLHRHLTGRNVKLTHGLDQTVAQLAAVPDPRFGADVAAFIDKLVSHYVLDGGRLVVAHAGIKQRYIGRASGRVREFCLFGDTTGEVDELGLPVRLDWAAEYRGKAAIAYGHTPVAEAQWLNNTINLDTGCVFGGKLTALRWPERTLHSVPSRQKYAEPGRPFLTTELAPSLQLQHDDLLDLDDVIGRRAVETRLMSRLTVREANASAALEVMSRFAVDPRWLVHLPPTMSPCATSDRDGTLEHPEEALRYFRDAGVEEVIAQRKHMGSRAVVIACRDASAGLKTFGIESEGVIYTRTGRAFFEDLELEAAILAEVRAAATQAGLWEELQTDFLVLDSELMPWSAKAQALLRTQYAPVGIAATSALASATELLSAAINRTPADPVLAELAVHTVDRRQAAEKYITAYRHYCWPVASPADYRLAPFHLLATAGHTHADKSHLWHMQVTSRLAAAGTGILMPTEHRLAKLDDVPACQAIVDWWEELTAAGGEGMVVKPLSFTHRSPKGLTQPAVKCRGREYLRIIYGPEYLLPTNLSRLRARGLNSKRSLALREFALGVEALERFTRREPLRRVHECIFAVLAMESEPVDPRL